MEKRMPSRREFLLGLGAAALVGAEGVRRSLSSEQDKQETPEPEAEFETIEPNPFFDGEPDYLRSVTTQNGEWTRHQRKKRRKTLIRGEEIFQDVGLTFYLVKRGDTISEIRERLGTYPEYAYLSDQLEKLDSFNIPARKLRANLWIPIPTESKDRQLTDAQFASYAHDAIEELSLSPQYGKEVERILKKVSTRDLVATMMAIAKQEGGGKPLGQFELHRWEPGKKVFSFSYFHVLMQGPGLTARKALNLTEGQLYHPRNGVKLFLAFVIEKNRESKKHADRLFPIWDHPEAFARFYNGKAWKRTNPHYVKNVRRYYDEADAHLDTEGRRRKKEKDE